MILRLVVAGVAMTVLAACGSGGPEPVPDPATSTTPATGTALSVVVSDGSGPTTEVSLSCDPTGGTHPDPAGACAWLAAGAEQGADPFAPVPADQACAEIYGGPQTATVTGVWQGRPVDAQYSRTDACQTNRWDRAKVLLALG